MTRRGAALPVVLAIITLVLVIGFAMGTLSTLSLQFSQQQATESKVQLAARSTISILLSELRFLSEKQTLNPLDPKPLAIRESFQHGLIHKEQDIKVQLTFDPNKPGYSTSNLDSDMPACGWSDKDGIARIPPFTLDVVLNIESSSGLSRYRVGLRQIWPYAAYTNGGPILLMSKTGLDSTQAIEQPSLVNGHLFTSDITKLNGNTPQQAVGYGLGLVDQPSKLLAFIETRNGRHPADPLINSLTLNVSCRTNLGINPQILEKESTASEQFIYYSDPVLAQTWNTISGDPTFYAANAKVNNDSGNVVNGYLYYNSEGEEQTSGPSLVRGENGSKVTIIKRRKLSADPLAVFDPKSDNLLTGSQGTSFSRLALKESSYEKLSSAFGLASSSTGADSIHYENQDGKAPYLLEEDLILSETENSTGGPLSTHYEVDRSIVNRQVVYDEVSETLYTRQTRSGIQLQNIVLHVKGDLDLGSVDPGSAAKVKVSPLSIIGSGATLIVDGRLILGEATINANDKSFVICANDIVLKIGGDFRGLMIAKESISILTSSAMPLNIRGALLCAGAGGITIFGANLEHDPRYLKAINSGGDFQIVSWTRL